MEFVLVAGAAGAAGAYIMRKVQKRRVRKSHQRWLTSNYNAPQLLDMQQSEMHFDSGFNDPWAQIEYQASRRTRGADALQSGIIIEELPPDPDEILLLENQNIPDALFKDRTEYRFNSREELDAFLRERGLESGPSIRSRKEITAFSSEIPSSSTSNLRQARRLEAYASYREEYEGPDREVRREAYKYSQQQEWERKRLGASRQPRGSSTYEAYPEQTESPYSPYQEQNRRYLPPPSRYSEQEYRDRYGAGSRPMQSSRGVEQSRSIPLSSQSYVFRERESEEERLRRERERERQRLVEDAFYGQEETRVPDTEQLFTDREEEARFRKMEMEREIERRRQGEREYLRALEESRWRRQAPALKNSPYGDEYPSGPSAAEAFAPEQEYSAAFPALGWEEDTSTMRQGKGEEQESGQAVNQAEAKPSGRVAALRAQLEKSGGVRIGAPRDMAMATAGTRAFPSQPVPIPPSYVPSPSQAPGKIAGASSAGRASGVRVDARYGEPSDAIGVGKWTPPPSSRTPAVSASGIGSEEVYSPARDLPAEGYAVEGGTDASPYTGLDVGQAGYEDYQAYPGHEGYEGYENYEGYANSGQYEEYGEEGEYSEYQDTGQYEGYEEYTGGEAPEGAEGYQNYEGYTDYGGGYNEYGTATQQQGHRSPVPPPIPPRFK